MSTSIPVTPTPPPVSIVTSIGRRLAFSDTSQLPAADAAFLASLETLLATAPGDILIFYNATNGDAIQISAQQADRTAFVVPPGVIAGQVASPAPSIAIDPDSISVLANAITSAAQSVATAAAPPAVAAPATQMATASFTATGVAVVTSQFMATGAASS